MLWLWLRTSRQWVSGLLASMFLVFAGMSIHASERPNIVYILADDLGYGEIQVYNPERGKIPTPNVDRLAQQGMMFTDAHAASSVCTPTRYGLMTGRYPWRSSLQRGVVGPGGHPPLIDHDRLTVAEFLGDHGYHTACVGKWHLGFRYEEKRSSHPNHTAPAPVGSKIIGGPTTRGFDYFYGFPLSRSMSTLIENDRVVAERPPVEVLPNLTLNAVEYIRRRAEEARKGAPFFLYFALNSPHSPVVPSEDFQGKSGLNQWADYIMQTDWAVGQVLDALENTGLREHTLVIFASDNGTAARAANAEELEEMGHFPSAMLRGYKSDIWEGGHRVPFVARWPGVVKPGTRSDHLISLNDLMATAADMLDQKLPQGEGVDSVSILPLLKGHDKPVRKRVVHHSINGRFGIRAGEWKLNLCAGSGGWSMPTDEKARKQGRPQVQLYHLTEDVDESNNLQAERTDRVRLMIQRLRRDVRRGRSTPGPEQENDVKVDIWKGAERARQRFSAGQ